MAHVRDGAMLKCTGRMNSNENTNWRHGTVKAKVIIILSTVAVLHLVLGGMFLTGGCAPEDPPMPPGIYVPQPTAKPAPQQDETSAMLSAARESGYTSKGESAATEASPSRTACPVFILNVSLRSKTEHIKGSKHLKAVVYRQIGLSP